MSIFHYFSRDADKRAVFIFNLIAPIYGLVDGSLVNNYQKSIELVKSEIDIEGKSVLDIGTGTGAWAEIFLNNGASKVHGIDMATKMLDLSRKKHPEMSFTLGNAEDLNEIESGSKSIFNDLKYARPEIFW